MVFCSLAHILAAKNGGNHGSTGSAQALQCSDIVPDPADDHKAGRDVAAAMATLFLAA